LIFTSNKLTEEEKKEKMPSYVTKNFFHFPKKGIRGCMLEV
jgi:hypothetical protein